MKKKWLWEFSKRLIVVLTVLYIIERVYTAIVITMNGGAGIDTYITTGSEVFLAAVVSYAVKAGFENVFKIKKGENEE